VPHTSDVIPTATPLIIPSEREESVATAAAAATSCPAAPDVNTLAGRDQRIESLRRGFLALLGMTFWESGNDGRVV
jgi:hypothetical protein